jgi:RNA polymerase sigma factor (sigma-70 family)
MWLFGRKKNKNDEELVRDYFLTGDKSLCGALFENHVQNVYGSCLFYFRDKEKARDAVMQIFEKLLTELRKTDVRNFKGWLSFVVRNHCISELRKNKVKYTLPETYLDFEVREADPDEEMAIAEIREQQLLDALQEGLPRLNEKQRICVELFYLKSQSYEEISAETKYSLNEVKSYIQNGKRNLKIMIDAKIKNNKNAA